jgi:hypothetical protein
MQLAHPWSCFRVALGVVCLQELSLCQPSTVVLGMLCWAGFSVLQSMLDQSAALCTSALRGYSCLTDYAEQQSVTQGRVWVFDST